MPLPPGPDLPSSRQTQAWLDQPLEFMEECAARFGDTFTLQLGSVGPTVLFSNPGAVHQVFQLPPDAYECRQFNEPYEYLMGERSLFVSDGAPHRRRRQLLTPPLQRQHETVYAPLVQEVTRDLVETWPAGGAVAVRPTAQLLSWQVMLRVIFGRRDADATREMTRLYASEVLQDLGGWRPWTRFGRLQPRFRDLISGAARDRRERPEADDPSLLDVLVAARGDGGEPLDDAEIQDHIFTLLVAGVDPVAAGVAWALYWTHELPAVREGVVRELAGLGADPDPHRLAQLPYLTAVCQEALRIYPILAAPSGRKLTAPARIMDHSLEPGTTLLPSIYLVHRREDLYPEAGRFRPERFLERRFAGYEYFPFGGGSRVCIGARLAPLVMRVAVATILSRRDLEPAARGPVRPARQGTMLAPPEDLRLVVTGPARLGV